MTTGQLHLKETAEVLTSHFLQNFPLKAAQACTNLPPEEASTVLRSQTLALAVNIFRFLPAGAADSIFHHWPQSKKLDLLLAMDIQQACALLGRQEDDAKELLLLELEKRNAGLAKEFRDVMTFPEDSAGRLMDPALQVFLNTLTCEEVLDQIKLRRPKKLDVLYLVNKDQQLTGSVDLAQLILADGKAKVSTIAKTIRHFAYAIDAEDEIIEKFEGMHISTLPILDANDQLIGVIRSSDIYQQTKEDLASDMASMVGASKDEKALSSSFFSVKKRMPWLQINLLTAFAAAAVVGAFQDLIDQFTVLSVLLGVAAGQSGNAGAQALAVTMRGLTLKEITIRQWLRVFRKESAVGFMNGIAIAVTCGIGVYIWSQSFGLALVLSVAMIISLTIACGSGALVPMILKRFGMDPAQSSSIVLTTVTDIAGFGSFLGIASLFTSMLPAG